MAETSNPLDGLEERLKSHSKAFESLLALTPAQEYYGTSIVDGRDPSEQWRAKKQSKAEKKAARKAKLDPANQKSALDVMKERERKRKRELGMDSDADEDGDEQVGVEAQDVQAPTKKRSKLTEEPQIDEDKRREKAEKRKQQRERKKEKQNKLKAKKDAKLSKKQADADPAVDTEAHEEVEDATEGQDIDMDVEGLESELEDVNDLHDAAELDDHNADGIDEDDEDNGDNVSTASSNSDHDSPAFDISTNHSTASSSSSILPPSEPESAPKSATTTTTVSKSTTAQPSVQQSHKPALNIALPSPPTAAAILKAAESDSRTSSPKPQIPKIDQAILQERLRVRIEELRAKRKADGADGQPARSRQELLEQRRNKADQRKAHKKELRKKAKEDEARKQEERLRGSGSPLSGADIFSPRSESNSFSFSRLAFSDGSMTDPSLTKLVDAPKRKGAQDPKTALLAAENKQKRLAGLDEQKRSDIGEKDMWLNASKRTHGERVRDDQSLLKKALKRKEKQKAKSEKEWSEREQAVVKGKEMKQKKREDNLAKRREEKKGGSKKKPVKKAGKKRPGFEGRFKA